LQPKIKIAFLSGTDELNARLVERMRAVFPELPLYVVSDFSPAEKDLHWVRYRGGFGENLARCRSAFRGKSIRLAGVLLVPNLPFRRMRLLALILAPFYVLAVNENLNDFMLRPGSLPAIASHFAWRTGNFMRWHLSRNGWLAHRRWHDLPYIAACIAAFLRIRWPGTRAAMSRADEASGIFCHAEVASGAPLRYILHGDRAATCDPARLRELAGPDPANDSAETRVLDICYRAWQRGWPTVGKIANEPEIVSEDYLKFLARTVSSPQVFREYWERALRSLHAAANTNPSARRILWRAPAIAIHGGPSLACPFPERLFLALTEGASAIYAGKPASGKPRVLIVSAYLPFPLSHGGAVRIHNLTARAAADWDQVLVCFAETDTPPPPELLARFVEIVLIQRAGSHTTIASDRPEAVEQFSSDAFRAALRLTVSKWSPVIAQLEFTQMAQYAGDCAPASPILVEHDITFDLYRQMAQQSDDWDLQRELKRWESFETAAWREMKCVVAMSGKDQAAIAGTRSVVLPNGVDPDRFRVSFHEPEPRRILFVGSFSHLPNLMALAFFLDDAWPCLRGEAPDVTLHIIAGSNHEYFLDYHSRQVRLRLNQPGIEIEGFVADVRPAYERAAVVIAPLVASAGTNLKILEAMACGRPVVSTPAGVNGLDLAPGTDFVLVHTGAEMADAIAKLFASPDDCRRLSTAGRRRVEESYGWDEIAHRQTELYRELLLARRAQQENAETDPLASFIVPSDVPARKGGNTS
jgi:glycosyltransferase involved in cell wall biosynthesis